MPYVADFHTHSRYSLATSCECTLEGLHYWAQLKGVTLVGTGDATHPAWREELRAKLEPAGPGLYRLRAEFAEPVNRRVPACCRAPVQFVITAEVSSVFRRGERTRKVHSLLLFPSLEASQAFAEALTPHAKLAGNGRPTTRLDPRQLLELALAASPQSILIPAHIWTPWFSLFGAKSGFDSLADCFGDLAGEVFAVETGLSSDPPMNWRWSALDRLTLVSNSDLHSPKGMARNANRFFGEPDYYRLRAGLRSQDPAVCGGTIDMFPEEGKYHADGHRKCGVVLTPEEAASGGGQCPVCGKPLTLGVLHRIADLADRPAGFHPPGAPPHVYIIPLAELLAEIHGVAPASKKVSGDYQAILNALGPELRVLLETETGAVAAAGWPRLGEALRRVRAGEVIRKPGFDGQYGEIRVFADGATEGTEVKPCRLPDSLS